jgi:hypothetical protein
MATLLIRTRRVKSGDIMRLPLKKLGLYLERSICEGDFLKLAKIFCGFGVLSEIVRENLT